MKNNALLVIDMINDIVAPNGKIASCAKYISEHPVIENINKLINYFRENKLPIFFIRLAFKPDYSDCPPDWSLVKEKEAFKDGTWGTEIYKQIDFLPNQDISIRKNRVSPFKNTDLYFSLDKHKINQLFITGVATNNAIDLCAREAWDNDYSPIIITDACGASDEEHHNAALFSLPPMIIQKTICEFFKEL
jgi:ureidoacrylate peracid hydrolase